MRRLFCFLEDVDEKQRQRGWLLSGREEHALDSGKTQKILLHVIFQTVLQWPFLVFFPTENLRKVAYMLHM